MWASSTGRQRYRCCNRAGNGQKAPYSSVSSPVLATNPSYAGCASCCMVTHTSSQGTPSTRWGVRYCASVLDRCRDRMRRTTATVFSHMDGCRKAVMASLPTPNPPRHPPSPLGLLSNPPGLTPRRAMLGSERRRLNPGETSRGHLCCRGQIRCRAAAARQRGQAETGARWCPGPEVHRQSCGRQISAKAMQVACCGRYCTCPRPCWRWPAGGVGQWFGRESSRRQGPSSWAWRQRACRRRWSSPKGASAGGGVQRLWHDGRVGRRRDRH